MKIINHPVFFLFILCISILLVSCGKDEELAPISTTAKNSVELRSNMVDSLFPMAEHYSIMGSDLKKLKYNDPLLAELIRMKRSGSDISVSNSVVLNGSSFTKFAIFIPIFKNSVCDFVLAYERYNGEFLFYIISESYVKNLILSPNNATDSEQNKLNIMAAGLNAIHFVLNDEIDSILNNFIISNSIDSLDNRIVSDRACIYDLLLVPTFTPWGEYLGNEGVKITLTPTTFIWCDEIVLPNVIYSVDPYEPRTINSGNAPNIDLPPSTMIDLNCWQNGLTASVKSQIYEILESYVDPCNLESINNIITNIMIEACTERSENGSDTDNSFLETLEDAIFGQDIINRINSELENVDKIIIDPLVCPNVKCILDKLLLYSDSINDTPGFWFLDCDDRADFTFKVGNISQAGIAFKNFNEITINSKYCESNADPIELVETILHESMHLALWAVETYTKNEDPNISPELEQAYIDLVENFKGNHHEYLAAYLEGIAYTLWNMNGQIGNPEDYWGLIWNGLNDGAGVDPITGEAFSLYINSVINTPGNNPHNLNYKDWIHGQLNRYLNVIKPNNNLKFDCK